MSSRGEDAIPYAKTHPLPGVRDALHERSRRRRFTQDTTSLQMAAHNALRSTTAGGPPTVEESGWGQRALQEMAAEVVCKPTHFMLVHSFI